MNLRVEDFQDANAYSHVWSHKLVHMSGVHYPHAVRQLSLCATLLRPGHTPRACAPQEKAPKREVLEPQKLCVK